MAEELSQDEINKIMAGMDAVYAEEAKRRDAITPRCHFRKMSFEIGEDESWWECRHCGHTKEVK